MDLVSLPTTPSGNKFLFTATDLFTKFIFLRAIPDKSAASVSKAILELFHTHGPPHHIITDQHREFVNAVRTDTFTDSFCEKTTHQTRHDLPIYTLALRHAMNMVATLADFVSLWPVEASIQCQVITHHLTA